MRRYYLLSSDDSEKRWFMVDSCHETTSSVSISLYLAQLEKTNYMPLDYAVVLCDNGFLERAVEYDLNNLYPGHECLFCVASNQVMMERKNEQQRLPQENPI